MECISMECELSIYNLERKWNYYSEEGEKFAYFMCPLCIDNEKHNVRIAVKKKYNSNHFYIHHIDTEKSSELLSPSKEMDNYEIQNL